MSTTATPPPAPTPAAQAPPTVLALQMKGAITISVFVCVMFLACLVVAYFAKSDTLLTAMVGGVNTLIATVVGYWVGSSAGSAKKDDALAAAAAGAPPPAGTVTTTTTPPAPAPAPAAAPAAGT